MTGWSNAEIAEYLSDKIDAYLSATGNNPTFRAGFGWLTPKPEVSEIIYQIDFADGVTFSNDFAGSHGYCRGLAPASAFVLNVLYFPPNSIVSSNVGTITINTDRTVSWLTTGGTLLCDVGSALRFVAPATQQEVTEVSLMLIGNYNLP